MDYLDVDKLAANIVALYAVSFFADVDTGELIKSINKQITEQCGDDATAICVAERITLDD